MLAGIRFVRHTQILLGAILLDLMAVLFGGAVALLPLFARSILHVGPTGLGVLRSAPAVGALLAAAVLTRRPLGGRAGRKLLIVVGAVRREHRRVRPLALLLAVAAGARVERFRGHVLSMNIRSTTVALASPDRLRGRVLAVEMVFISASNQLGAFESGLAAFLLGAVPAVVAGGVMTMLLALSWRRLFPALARSIGSRTSGRPSPRRPRWSWRPNSGTSGPSTRSAAVRIPNRGANCCQHQPHQAGLGGLGAPVRARVLLLAR